MTIVMTVKMLLKATSQSCRSCVFMVSKVCKVEGLGSRVWGFFCSPYPGVLRTQEYGKSAIVPLSLGARVLQA